MIGAEMWNDTAFTTHRMTIRTAIGKAPRDDLPTGCALCFQRHVVLQNPLGKIPKLLTFFFGVFYPIRVMSIDRSPKITPVAKDLVTTFCHSKIGSDFWGAVATVGSGFGVQASDSLREINALASILNRTQREVLLKSKVSVVISFSVCFFILSAVYAAQKT